MTQSSIYFFKIPTELLNSIFPDAVHLGADALRYKL